MSKELIAELDARVASEETGWHSVEGDTELIRRAAAALRAQEWQPIETAPDGQWIVTARMGENGFNLTKKIYDADDDPEWVNMRGQTTVTHSTFLPPTHWRPITPPETRDE